MAAPFAAIRILGTFNRVLGTVSVFVASALAGLMAVIVTIGVFWRYVLNNSLPWVEDFALIMMVTMAFIIAPYAYRTGQNVAITILVEALPRILIYPIRIMINILVLWIVYRYFIESLGIVDRGWAIRLNSVDVPWAYPYMIIPVVFVQLGLVAIELIARDTWCLLTGSGEADLPELERRKSTG
ncbi:MAG: TRAP transporter small permease subunit [Rhodobacteraceae bacterium]|nr:TRAP transporter small permease subunit [Paracoccaceae bacterium]